MLHDGLGGTAGGFRVEAGQDGDTVVVRATGRAPLIVPFLPDFQVDAEARGVRRGRGAPPVKLSPGERGSAVVEVAVLGSLVFGVLVHVLVVFGGLHRATLATSAAAREYGRAIVVAGSESEAARAGAAAVELVGRNHGLAPGALHPSVTGLRHRGEVLVVRVRTEVPIARIPFLGAVWRGLAVPVEATHAVRLDRYRSGG